MDGIPSLAVHTTPAKPEFLSLHSLRLTSVPFPPPIFLASHFRPNLS
jgi:hypothetical protein